MSSPESVLISFGSGAVDDGDLLVTRLEGVDTISRLYCYELKMVSKKATIDLDKVLANEAFIGIKQGIQLSGSDTRGKRTAKVNGVVTAFEQHARVNDQVIYRAVLQPRLWKLSRNFVSQVYLDSDVPTIVEENLKAAGLDSADYEFRLSGSYPVREYVVQYEETDLDFINRWLEHEGICFFFEQTEDGDKVIFADAPAGHRDIVGHPQLAYRPQAQTGGDARGEVRDSSEGTDDWFAEEVITSVIVRKEAMPAEVQLKDYNWRNPADPLIGKAPVRDDGFGLMWEYNDHYKTEDEGNRLAEIRAGEWLSREVQLTGTGDCRSFAAGALFELVDHYRPDVNAPYLITRVVHQATQTVSLASSSSVSATYSNEWSAMPNDRTFRPERLTEWPAIKGVIHGVVEAAGDDSKYAMINETGAYKVRLPFDVAGADKGNGAASRWIRMAQPYSGNGYGTHFPLHANTEVLLTHIDGDPDRPIISATVPNAANPSPVNQGNAAKNVIRSSSGNLIEMDDTEGSEGIVMINGAGTSVRAWRNKGAGGGGGAGGVHQPTSGSSHSLFMPESIGGSLPAVTVDALSPRVGIFSGPLGAMSLDAGDRAPVYYSPDGGDDGGDAGSGSEEGGSATAVAEPPPMPEGFERPAAPQEPDAPEAPDEEETKARAAAAVANAKAAAQGEGDHNKPVVEPENLPGDDAEAAFFAGANTTRGEFHSHLDKVANGSDPFAKASGDAKSAMDNAAEFSAVKGSFNFVEGDNLAVQIGHHGSYLQGNASKIAKGAVSSSLKEFDNMLDHRKVHETMTAMVDVAGDAVDIKEIKGAAVSEIQAAAKRTKEVVGGIYKDIMANTSIENSIVKNTIKNTVNAGASITNAVAGSMNNTYTAAANKSTLTIVGGVLSSQTVAPLSTSIKAIGADVSQTICPSALSTFIGQKNSINVGETNSIFAGQGLSLALANKVGVYVGANTSVKLGAFTNIVGGIALDVFAGLKVIAALACNIKMQASVDIGIKGADLCTALFKVDQNGTHWLQ